MSIFEGLKTEGLEETQDRLGGFQPLDSDCHEATIKLAYAGQSTGGARSVTLLADVGGKEYRETIYITTREGKNFYLNKNDNTKKVPLPGFTTIDDLCLVTTNKPLSEQASEEKMVNVYDPEAKAEKPTSVPVLTDLIGQKVYLGILRQLENKNEKDGNGNYVATAATRETNIIDKVFHHPTRMTVVEARKGAEKPDFCDAWTQRNKDQIRDRREIKDGQATAGTPGGGAPAAGGGAPRKSLFGS